MTCCRQPFFYLTVGLATGILVDSWAGPPPWLFVMMAAVSITASVGATLSRKDGAATAGIIISIVAVGAMLASNERSAVSGSRLKRLYEARVFEADQPVELTGVLVTHPEPAPGAYYLDIEAEALRARAETVPATGCARLRVPLSDNISADEYARLRLDYGSRVRVLVRLERATSYGNPGSPDFNDFLERKGYDLKGTIKSPLLIEPLGKGASNRVLALLYRFRFRLMAAIDACFSPTVGGTLKAMLADNRYYLSPEASERLREGGTFHIMSISGMHMAIIAWALLGGRVSFRKRRPARVIFCLLTLWAYAVMVGLEPPVTRATLMISVGLVGPLVFRRAASINTVSLAAFAMLSLKPSLVADPGFQLSFIAVAAIVALALPIAERLRLIGEWRPGARTPHPSLLPVGDKACGRIHILGRARIHSRYASCPRALPPR